MVCVVQSTSMEICRLSVRKVTIDDIKVYFILT